MKKEVPLPLLVLSLVLIIVSSCAPSPSEEIPLVSEAPAPEAVPPEIAIGEENTGDAGNTNMETSTKNTNTVTTKATSTKPSSTLPGAETAVEPETLPLKTEKQSSSTPLILPTLTYPNAYNGPLYATSEQIGDSAPFSHRQNLQRNGVNFMIAFFGIEIDPQEEEDLAILYAQNFVKAAPSRVIPFFSPGYSSEETKPLLGKKLTTTYRDTLAAVKEQAGENFIHGLGEIEQYAWDIQPNDPTMLELFDLAAQNKLAVMFHPAVGQANGVKAVVEKYPTTTFLIHLFPEDLSRDRQEYINILKTNNNLYFSVDVDHLLFDGQTGLLYKYEDDEVKTAARKFVSNYDSNEQTLLNSALQRYQPLIEAVPDKVMWGTEGGTDYVYEPEVYDRMIKFTRLFIGKLKPEGQEKFAYKNALRVFGEGEG